MGRKPPTMMTTAHYKSQILKTGHYLINFHFPPEFKPLLLRNWCRSWKGVKLLKQKKVHQQWLANNTDETNIFNVTTMIAHRQTDRPLLCPSFHEFLPIFPFSASLKHRSAGWFGSPVELAGPPAHESHPGLHPSSPHQSPASNAQEPVDTNKAVSCISISTGTQTAPLVWVTQVALG